MRKLIISLLFMLSVNAILSAQTRVFDEKIFSDKDSVTVSFKVDSHKGLPSRLKEIIIPYIYNGKDTLWFDALEVYGKGRFMRERQEKYYEGDSDWELSGHQVLAKDIYAYESKVPVRRWMKTAGLGLKRHLAGCNCDREFSDAVLLTSAELYSEPEIPVLEDLPVVAEPPVVAEVPIAKPVIKMDFGRDEMEIVFKVSKFEIDSTVLDNEVTFEKILASVDKIYSDSLYRVDRIEVAGYASPEGDRDFNSHLAERRALALIDYIIASRPQYNLTRKDFHIHNGEVNWEGLRQYLDHSNIEEKDWIKVVIGSNMPDERKKSILMSIDGGRLWRKLLDEVFPHLRSARFLGVYYGSTNNDNAANEINQANDMIRNGDYVDAYNHLLHLQDDIRAYNTIGVSLMMQGMYDEAMEWFEMAVENGFPMAAKNINSINSQRESAQKEMMVEYLKQYE